MELTLVVGLKRYAPTRIILLLTQEILLQISKLGKVTIYRYIMN